MNDIDKDLLLSIKDLPFKATIKYLGWQQTKGLWGIKNTRRPVDVLVTDAKKNPKPVPLVRLQIDQAGLTYTELQMDETPKKKQSSQPPKRAVFFPIETISYGVQDLVYTRVFSMIIVTSTTDTVTGTQNVPFVCHSFVCDSRNQARQITCALAVAFEEYGRRLKVEGKNVQKRFHIDLRTPEQQKNENDSETEA